MWDSEIAVKVLTHYAAAEAKYTVPEWQTPV